MLNRYPFILPIFVVWFVVFFIPLAMIFYTKFGLQRHPILNRTFSMRCVSMTLFIFILLMLMSGLLQLAGEQKVIFSRSTGYWHALVGFLLLLAALDHIVIHIRDIYRYIVKPKPKKQFPGQSAPTQ
ncbi:MAG: hypothetical protein WC505_02180 [Patescibacteria group bacterium]